MASHGDTQSEKRLLLSKLTLRQLQILSVIAEHGSILGGSKRLNMTQPAVSRAIKEIEGVLGVKLFERTAKGVTPTPGGTAFIGYVRSALSEMRSAWYSLSDIDGPAAGRLVIGSLPNGASGPLPRALAELRRARPGVIATVMEGLFDQLIPALRAGELDFVFGRLGQFSRQEGLDTRKLYDQEWVVMARATHPLAGSNGVTLPELMNREWILPFATSPVRHLVEEFFRRAGLKVPQHHLEMSALGISRALLLETDAVIFLPRGSFRPDEERGDIAELTVRGIDTRDPVGIIWRRGRHPTPIDAHFRDMLEQCTHALGLA